MCEFIGDFFCSKFYFKIYEVNLKVNKICWHLLVFNFLTLQCVTGKSDVKNIVKISDMQSTV